MKYNLSLCILCLAVACALAARRTSSSGRSRGSSRGSSRGKAKAPAPSASTNLDHHGLASLSYSGYGQPAAAKPKQKPQPKPSAPQQESRPVGWNSGAGETAVRKNVADSQSGRQQSHAYPAGGASGSNVQQNHAYPAGGASGSSVQQNHAYPAGSNPGHAYPAAGAPAGSNLQQSHSYPASSNTGYNGASNVHAYPSSSGLSGGTNQAPSYGASNPVGSNVQHQSHAYPASNGLSGQGAGAPPPYQAQPGAVPQYTHSGYPYQGQPGYTSGVGHGGYPAGGNPSYTGGFPNNGQQNYPGYSHPSPGGLGYGGMGAMGGYGGYGGYGSKYGGYGGVGRSSNVLTGLGIAGAGVGTILTGLALYNLARGGSSTRHYHHYDHNKGVADVSGEKLDPATEAMLANLANCTMTIESTNNTEIVAIPCVIATSFAPNSDSKKTASVEEVPSDLNVNCTITVTSKDGSEQRTSIPCTILMNLGANATNSETPPGLHPLPSNPESQPLNPAFVNQGGPLIGNENVAVTMNPLLISNGTSNPELVNQPIHPASTPHVQNQAIQPISQPENSPICSSGGDGAADLKCLPPVNDDLSVIPLGSTEALQSTSATAPAA